MQIRQFDVTVREIAENYINNNDENGVIGYNGKLNIRPAYQREFVYKDKQRDAVINTIRKGYPLNVIYWAKNTDGSFDVLDGQQRTISFCDYVAGKYSIDGEYFHTLTDTEQDEILNYHLIVFVCEGTDKDRLDWFRTINIAGEELYPQELRNANYVSPWLTDAKRYFSKANASSTAKCPAERIGGQYTNKNANRQEILAQVISWRIGSNEDADICQYMEDHIHDEDASDLWNYFNEVINWINEIFPGVYDKGMASVNWGVLYNQYGKDDLDPDDICAKFDELIEFKASKELDVSVAKITEYCITRDEKLLKHRQFSEAQRSTLYNRQKGICPDCGQHYLKSDMHAHHIIPWYNGGITDLSNGVMLCKECHTLRHANS